ncbi:hypothetical protein ULMS_02330 [Patiriisocius marinistellae]|uniref:Uncharacterized protein n=1 Tax=Patiriisocius marinistellae TaxID=2494560 RepID=A0A5J4FXE9_9FLAO|nr:hypothetical protein [Patiriisocius marinistellae]GEQ84725.1 hypothetical protein ULMS_02330 [Patiriisocius marinistellae]
MTTISIKEELHFDRTSFDTLEEFQMYVLLKQNNQQFTEEQVALVKERIAEADLCEEPGLTWEQVKKALRTKNA